MSAIEDQNKTSQNQGLTGWLFNLFKKPKDTQYSYECSNDSEFYESDLERDFISDEEYSYSEDFDSSEFVGSQLEM